MTANPARSEKALRAFALSLPGAWEDHPWGENVAKVGKKVFVFFGVPEPGELKLCVKLPDSGLDALDLEGAEPAGYGLGKSGWVMFRFRASSLPPPERMQAWIVESYRSIAPKKLVRELDARGG